MMTTLLYTVRLVTVQNYWIYSHNKGFKNGMEACRMVKNLILCVFMFRFGIQSDSKGTTSSIKVYLSTYTVSHNQ